LGFWGGVQPKQPPHVARSSGVQPERSGTDFHVASGVQRWGTRMGDAVYSIVVPQLRTPDDEHCTGIFNPLPR
ncbi:TPA: hypothetical protein ACNEZX_005237, partial [Escherichia coli]